MQPGGTYLRTYAFCGPCTMHDGRRGDGGGGQSPPSHDVGPGRPSRRHVSRKTAAESGIDRKTTAIHFIWLKLFCIQVRACSYSTGYSGPISSIFALTIGCYRRNRPNLRRGRQTDAPSRVRKAPSRWQTLLPSSSSSPSPQTTFLPSQIKSRGRGYQQVAGFVFGHALDPVSCIRCAHLDFAHSVPGRPVVGTGTGSGSRSAALWPVAQQAHSHLKQGRRFGLLLSAIMTATATLCSFDAATRTSVFTFLSKLRATTQP